MSKQTQEVPVLTPANGVRYHNKKDCLDAYLKGEAFVAHLPGSPLDTQLVNRSILYFKAVVLRYGSKSFLFEGD